MNYYQCPVCSITDEYERRCFACGALVHVRSDDTHPDPELICKRRRAERILEDKRLKEETEWLT